MLTGAISAKDTNVITVILATMITSVFIFLLFITMGSDSITVSESVMFGVAMMCAGIYMLEFFSIYSLAKKQKEKD